MSIGFSQTFRLDLDLLAKMLDQYAQDPLQKLDVISETLGIGRRKVEGLNGWLKQLRLRDTGKRQLTDLARLIHDADPSMQDRGTHILLHYLLVSNREAEVWYGLFSEFLSPYKRFTREDVLALFESRGVTSTHLGPDVGNLLKMYTANDVRALADLRLLDEVDGRNSLIPLQEIPPGILAFCLYDYRHRRTTEATTSVERLLTEPERPGRLFGLTESELRGALKALEWEGWLTIVSSADIDGIAYTYDGEPLALLRKHYDLT